MTYKVRVGGGSGKSLGKGEPEYDQNSLYTRMKSQIIMIVYILYNTG